MVLCNFEKNLMNLIQVIYLQVVQPWNCPQLSIRTTFFSDKQTNKQLSNRLFD